MKSAQLKALAVIATTIEQVKSELETIAGEARSEFDEKGEKAQESDKGQALDAAASLEEAVQSLEEAFNSVEEVTNAAA
jgi:vacuolar-type H+-ATPase subunit D/Vma8